MAQRALHAMLVIALVYVCSLNVLIVHNLYQHYGKRILTLPSAPQPATKRVPRNASRAAPLQACEQRHSAVLILCSPVTGTNDPTAHQALFAQLRTAFRVAEAPPPKVFLLVSVSNFASFHRSWCTSLYTATKHKTSCALLLRQDSPGLHAVLADVSAQEDCLSHLLTLPDNAALPSHWLASVNRLPRNKVTCLARLDPPARQQPGACAAPAYYLPERFLAEYKSLDSATSVESAARRWHMFYGNRVLIYLK